MKILIQNHLIETSLIYSIDEVDNPTYSHLGFNIRFMGKGLVRIGLIKPEMSGEVNGKWWTERSQEWDNFNLPLIKKLREQVVAKWMEGEKHKIEVFELKDESGLE